MAIDELQERFKCYHYYRDIIQWIRSRARMEYLINTVPKDFMNSTLSVSNMATNDHPDNVMDLLCS